MDLNSPNEFIIGGNETEITAGSYKKMIKNPMPFFKVCINDIDMSRVKNVNEEAIDETVKEIIDETIKEMRKKVVELYLS